MPARPRPSTCLAAPLLLLALLMVPAVRAEASTAASATFGATELGQARYPIPAGALFVATTGRDDHPGSLQDPLRTVQRAVDVAPDGATIVIRQGSYHETVRVKGKRLTIQNHPGEVVWFHGSRKVTGWVGDGRGPWRTSEGGPRHDVVQPASWTGMKSDPMAFHPDMLFVDGVEQRQVGGRHQVQPGTFHLDRSTGTVWLGTDPTGRHVEMAFLADALSLEDADGSTIRGIGFRRYATPLHRAGAVKLHGRDLVLENSVVQQMATAGVGVRGSAIRVDRVTATHNGQLGIAIDDSRRVTVTDSWIVANNQAGFGPGSAEGGIKVVASTDVTLRRNLVERNLGQGLWSDVSSSRVDFVSNIVRNNTRNGIQLEISARSVIADNLVHHNGGNGIYVLESHDVDVWNNTLVRNRVNLQVMEGGRISGGYPSWEVANVTIRNNVSSNLNQGGGRFLLGVEDASRRRSGSAMGVTSRHNAYHRSGPTEPRWLAAWSEWPHRMAPLSTLDEVQAIGLEQGSLSSIGGRNPYLADEGAGRLGRPATSPARGAGQPLPPRVASVVSRPAGQPVDIGAFSH